MKLTVINWLKDGLTGFTGRTIELLFRTILLLLPMGVFLALIQLRGKASSVSNISVYTEENSVWQHIFPGFMLVAVDPKQLKNAVNKMKKDFQSWVENNKYILAFLFMTAIVALMIINYIGGIK